jgi:hypothetical protein
MVEKEIDVKTLLNGPRFVERLLPIEFDLLPSRDLIYSGICIKKNRHIAILVNYSDETKMFDGYTVLRTREISRYHLWDSKEKAKANRDSLRLYIDRLPLERMNTIYSCLREASQIGLIAFYTGNDDSSYYVGHLTSIDRHFARFRLIRLRNPRPKYLKIRIDDINYFSFDTLYERELQTRKT